MANDTDIRLLDRGIRAWNAHWDAGSRKIARMEPANSEQFLFIPKDWSSVPNVRRARHPDLSGADLSGRNLAGINLQAADLTGASLVGAQLYGANLWNAKLANADLREATLDQAQVADVNAQRALFQGARMSNMLIARTDLADANLAGANLFSTHVVESRLSRTLLRNAHLVQVQFAETVFRGTDFTRCTFGLNYFGNCTFNKVKGLAESEYRFRSYLEPMTIGQSDPFPLEFYRGCGWPDELIDVVPALFERPIRLTSCFISYSTHDEELARLLHKDLSASGVRCWFAPEDLKVGEKFRDRIDDSIMRHDRLLLILSASSIASRWVEKEVETALELESTQKRSILIPIRVDEEALKAATGWAADIRRSRHIGDFREWRKPAEYRRAFDRLLRDLRDNSMSAI